MKKIKSAIFMAILLLSFVSSAKEKNKVEVAKNEKNKCVDILVDGKETQNYKLDA